MNYFQKLIRSSEIPREPLDPIEFERDLFNDLIRYRAHKLFGRPSWKMAPKTIYGENCPDT